MKVFAALHMSMNVCKSPLSIDFRLTNKFQQVSKFANTESVNDEDRLYLHLPRFDVRLKDIIYRNAQKLLGPQQVRAVHHPHHHVLLGCQGIIRNPGTHHRSTLTLFYT